MKTAVDSSVLLDVLGADARFGGRSREAFRVACDAGALVASDAEFHEALGRLGVRFEAIGPEAAALAGRLWRSRRMAARPSRDRVVADFLIGAHAAHQSDALLTRDRGFYRRGFRLRIIDPVEASESPA